MSSATFSVKEEVRISFTKKLHQLREGSLEVAEFPSTLNNIERKFLHKLAEELGLHSKSKGVGENRFITVWKTGETEQNARRSELTLNEDVVKLLEASNISSFKAQKSSRGNDARGVGDVASAKKDQAFLRNSYIKAQMARLNHKDHAKIQKKRAMLPAHQHSAAVRSLVANNQIVLISGETGCGKTTQVPQFLFDDETIGSTCRMAITQPRRLSAMSVSERIASERSEKIGQTVGYNIRLETEKSENTQMLFVTPGLLIRKLQNDPLLEEFTHIIIDEAHERDRFTEFLMIVLRDVCSKRPDLKLILMSATLHTNKLSAYFGGCPHIHMGGSVFPVQEFYLENVLKYTNFLSNNQNAKGVHGDRHANTHQKTQAMSKFIEMNQSYHCSLCNTNQVFKSPEELGTHAAFCYGVSSENGTGVRSRKPSQKPNLKALFKSYHSSLPQESVKSKGSHSQDNKGAMLLNALGKNKGNKSNDVNQHSEISVSYQNRSPSPDIDVLSDGGMSDTEDILDHPGTGTDAGFVDTVSADVDETATLDNDLVREYQKLWDDNQVDYDLITALLQYVVTSEFAKTFSTTGSSSGGSILIFLPGWDDISKLHRILAVHPIFSNANKFKILQLHSGIPKQGQKEIFQSVGASQHKIILSTNIAETSVTIDDVTVVIDTGRVKEKTYDPHVKLSFLKSTWISKASARQRKGRAGRTCAGVCFHLFSKMRSKNMAEFQDSELLRMPLEELVLQTKILGIAPGKGEETDSAQGFLLNALDPPHLLSITNAIQLLQMIGCIDENESITATGRAVSKLPMDPRISRIVLLGCLFGCGPALLSTTATMAYRDPFLLPTRSNEQGSTNTKGRLSSGIPSDQYAILRALEQFKTLQLRFGYHKANAFCDEHNLSRSTMSFLSDLTQQLTYSMKDVGIFMSNNKISKNNGNANLVSSLIGMALYPDIGVRNNGGSYTTEKGRKARVHPSSVNFKASIISKKSKVHDLMKVIGFQDLISATTTTHSAPGAAQLSMLNTTPLNTFALLLSSGVIKVMDSHPEECSSKASDSDDEDWATATDATASADPMVFVEIDGWITIRMKKSVADLVFICRNCIGNALEFFIDACEANKGDSNAAVQLPLHLLQSLDIITNCLTIESVQAISVKEQEYDNHNQSSQDNGKNSINLRHKYTRK